MSVTSTSTAILRQNSIQNEVYTEECLENQAAISRSSSSVPPEDNTISMLANQDSEEVLQEEPELSIVKVVKGFFHSLVSFFKRADGSTAPSQESTIAESQALSERDEQLLESEVKNEVADSPLTLARAIKQESELPEHQNHPVALVGSLTKDFLDAAEGQRLSLEASNKKEEAPSDKHAELALSVSADAADENRPLSDNQQYILKDLKEDLKDFFIKNRNNKKIIKILNKAEVYYCAILNSSLRRHKNLDANDKVSLALQNSREFVSSMYEKLKK